MDIGKEKPARIVTPLEEPVPTRQPKRQPVTIPAPAPAPEKVPERVPAKQEWDAYVPRIEARKVMVIG